MELDLSPAPYPGLRTFEQAESDIFFGRDDLVDAMLGKLEKAHFLCVTGTSGSGKSSLVRTGLFNALLAGYLRGTGSDWVICDMRPGEAPLERLVDALARAVLRNPHDEDGAEPERVAALAGRLASYIDEVSSDLNPALDELADLGDRPVIILADQFEELHRYTQKDRHATSRFVDVLLKTAEAAGRVYVVITVRHEELAHCARFPGLNGAINASQFLTPALDRYQMQEAIEGPIRLFGGEIDPRLTVRMLNDLETEMDKLPLMQHALKLLYERRKSRQPLVIGVEDFNDVFELRADRGFNAAASRHALRRAMSNRLDRIHDRLPADLRLVTPRAFSALTNMTSEGRDIRNPVTLGKLAEIIDRPVEDTIRLIEAFIEGEDGYLRASGPLTAADNPEIDVRHECVLRIWERLQDEWLPGEARNAQMFKDLARRARGWDGRRSLWRRLRDDALLRGTALRQYHGWWKENAPNRAWAERHLAEVNAEGKTGRHSVEDDDAVTFGHTKAFVRVSQRAEATRGAFVMGGGLAAVAAVVASVIVVLVMRAALADKQASDQKAVLRLISAISSGEVDDRPTLAIATAVDALRSALTMLGQDDIQRAENKLWQVNFDAFERGRFKPSDETDDAGLYSADFVGGGDRIVTLTQAPVLRVRARDGSGAVTTYDLAETLGLDGHLGRAMRVAPDSTVAAVGTDKGALVFADLGDGTMTLAQDPVEADSGSIDDLVMKMAHDPAEADSGPLVDLAFSADGRLLAAASPKNPMVRLYERDGPGPLDWRAAREFSLLSPAFSVALNADGSNLAMGLAGGKVCLIALGIPDAETICSAGGHQSSAEVKALAFHPEGDVLVSAGTDDRVVVWHILPVRTPGAQGRHFVSADINLWHETDVWGVDFDPVGQYLATISWDGAIRLYNADNWQPLALMQGHTEAARSVVFAPDGHHLLSASLDGSARLWTPFAPLAADDGFSHQFASVGSNGSPRSILGLAFGPEAGWIALTDGTAVMVKAQEGPPRSLDSPDTDSSRSARYVQIATGRSATAATIIAASLNEAAVHLWIGDPEAGFSTGRMTLAAGDASARELAQRPVAIAPDGTRLAVGVGSGSDSSVLVCPLDEAQPDMTCAAGSPGVVQVPLPELAGLSGACALGRAEPRALDFSHDGTRLAVGMQDCSLRIIDLTAPDERPESRTDHAGAITSVDFGDDGSLITGSTDHTARFWPDMRSASVPLAGVHNASVTDVQLVPGSTAAVTVSWDEVFAIWDIGPSAGATLTGPDATGAVEAKVRTVLPGHSATITALDLAMAEEGQVLMASGTEGGTLLVMPYFATPEALCRYSAGILEPIIGRAVSMPSPEMVEGAEADPCAGPE